MSSLARTTSIRTGSPKKSPKKTGKKSLVGAAKKRNRRPKTISELVKGLNTRKTVENMRKNLKTEDDDTDVTITKSGAACLKQLSAELAAGVLMESIATMALYNKRTGAFRGRRSTVRRVDIINGIAAIERKKCIA